MALASSTFSIDFSGLPNTNPYTNANITNVNGTAQIAGGIFRPNTLAGNTTPQRFVYNGETSGDNWRVSMRLGASGNYNANGVGFIDPATGNGYGVQLTWNSHVNINRYDGNTIVAISAGAIEINPEGLSDDAIIHLDFNRATGALLVLYEDPNATVPVTTPTATECDATDTTYAATLKPAMIFLCEDQSAGAFVIDQWGADAGGGGGGGTATKLGIASQPGNTVVGEQMSSLVISALTDDDEVDASFIGNATVAIQTGTGTLTGTLTRPFVSGYALFGDLAVNTLNTGLVLRASSDGLTSIDTAPFDIIAGGGSGGSGGRSPIGSLIV